MGKEYSEPEVHDIDSGLMLRVKGGDKKAFDELMKKYQRPVFNMAYRFLGNVEDAEEIAQEVFLQLYKAAPNYRPISKFLTYLLTVTKNLCFNWVRDKKGIRVLSIMEDEEILELPDPKETPLEAIEKKEIREIVANTVQALPL